MKKILLGFIAIGIITFVGCEKDPLVTITTLPIGSITTSGAKSGGIITNNRGRIYTKGIVWGTSSNPTKVDNISSSESGPGSFTSNLSGLTSETTYYVRAYFETYTLDGQLNSSQTSYDNLNSSETSYDNLNSSSRTTYYGNELSFTTTGYGYGYGLTNDK